MTRRGQQAAETRRRITEAAIDLHGTIGPARTTISAIADLAGVDRLTVYRHFPNEAALFEACSGHWLAEHPYPDLGRWAAIKDPRDRLAAALTCLYAWYRENHAMLGNVLRDAAEVPSLADRPQRWAGYQAAVVDTLLPGRRLRGRRRLVVRAAIGHAAALETWRSLTGHGLDDETSVRLMLDLVDVSACWFRPTLGITAPSSGLTPAMMPPTWAPSSPGPWPPGHARLLPSPPPSPRSA